MVTMAAPAFAQEGGRRYEIGWNPVSYSRQGAANLYGGDLSFALKANEEISLVANFAVHTRSTFADNLTTKALTFGPRFYFQRTDRVSSFGEVLVGGTHVTGPGITPYAGNGASQSYNGFAVVFGGGVDFGIKPWFAIRAPEIDYSYLHFSGTSSDGIRIGAGIVFKFGS